MLEEFKESQIVAYTILKNALNKNKYAHAYIFEDKENVCALSLARAFIKELLTANEKNKENIIAMIDNDNHPEIKKINTDSLWIKKDQIKNLQEEFSKKPIFGNKKIYIIEEAEKLNKHSSNTILKFLEEPEENIIAILITKNVESLLDTIRSRCQLIKITNKNNNKDLFNLINFEQTEEDFNEKMAAVISFIHFYEDHKLETICFMQKLWHDYFNTKELCLMGFELMLIYYKECLNYLNGLPIYYFAKDIENIKKIVSKQNQMDISFKLEKINYFKDNIKLNANLSLLMDKLIIDLDGGV